MFRLMEEVDRGGVSDRSACLRKEGTKYDPTEESELVDILRSRLCCTVPPEPILATDEQDLPGASFPSEAVKGLLGDKDRTYAMMAML